MEFRRLFVESRTTLIAAGFLEAMGLAAVVSSVESADQTAGGGLTDPVELEIFIGDAFKSRTLASFFAARRLRLRGF